MHWNPYTGVYTKTKMLLYYISILTWEYWIWQKLGTFKGEGTELKFNGRSWILKLMTRVLKENIEDDMLKHKNETCLAW